MFCSGTIIQKGQVLNGQITPAMALLLVGIMQLHTWQILYIDQAFRWTGYRIIAPTELSRSLENQAAVGCLQELTLLCKGLSLLLLLHSVTALECEGLQQPHFPHCSPVKFAMHPEQGPVTVVLVNFKRPNNIRKIVDNMVTYRNVAEILVVSNNPNTSFTYSCNA